MGRRNRYPHAWLAPAFIAAFLLDCSYIPVAAAALMCANVTMSAAASLSVFAPEGISFAVCLACGLALDVIRGKVTYVILLPGLGLAIRAAGEGFYSPGSVFHVAAGLLFLVASGCVEAGVVFSETGRLIAVDAFVRGTALNAAVFLITAFWFKSVFREKEKLFLSA